MKFDGINEVLFDEAYDELLARYSEGGEDFMQPCAKKRSSSANQPKKPQARKSNAGQKPRKPAAPTQKKTAPKKPNACAPKAKSKSVSFAEVYDFQLCQRPDGSHYGTGGTCRKGTPTTREDTMAGMEKALGKKLSDGQKQKLASLSDGDLGRVATAVEKQGLTPEQGQQVSKAVEALKATVAGGPKQGGDNLQEPEMAAKYASFYEAKKDISYKPPGNTSNAEVKAVLAQLKDEIPAKEYQAIKNKLASKGTPSPEQKAEWKDKGGNSARGEAVLKSLMDNNFKTVMGEEVSWNQGMQLDHKQAGSTGGKDTPSNWIWISSPTNQTKGGLEAAVSGKNLTPQQTETVIRQGLITKLNQNASMTSAQVASAKSAGSAKVTAKAQQVQAVKDNFPLMKPSQLKQRIDGAKGADLKLMMQGSVSSVKNPATGRKASYRMMKPDSRGGRGAYPRTEEMRSLMRVRWGQSLSKADLNNMGSTLTYFGAKTRQQRSDKLDELLGNFPPTSGLTAAQRIAILDAE